MPEEEHITLNDELIYALYHDENADCIRALLAAGADANADDGCGATALHLAVERNAPDIVQLLIESGGCGCLRRRGILQRAAQSGRLENKRLTAHAAAPRPRPRNAG